MFGDKSQKGKFLNPDFTVHILRETKKSFDPKVTFTNIKFLQSSLCEKKITKTIAMLESLLVWIV